MADKDKETEDFEIVDALKEGTDGGPVEITESGLTLNLGMGSEDEYNEAAPQEVSAEELRALVPVLRRGVAAGVDGPTGPEHAPSAAEAGEEPR